MRLANEEQSAISDTIHQADADAMIYLFGSRADDAATGATLDRIYRAEKRGWANAAELIKIRELRNLIAHEYATEKMPDIYTAVAAMSAALLAAVPKVIAYAHNTIQRYPA